MFIASGKLAEYMLGDARRFDALTSVRDARAFEHLVETARAAGHLGVDDTTLVRFVVP